MVFGWNVHVCDPRSNLINVLVFIPVNNCPLVQSDGLIASRHGRNRLLYSEHGRCEPCIDRGSYYASGSNDQ